MFVAGTTGVEYTGWPEQGDRVLALLASAHASESAAVPKAIVEVRDGPSPGKAMSCEGSLTG